MKKRFITHHKGVGKLKIWEAVDAASLYNSLLINRGISSSDLDIYEVTNGHHSLYDTKDFSVSDTQIICNEKIKTFDSFSHEVKLTQVLDDEVDQLTAEQQAERAAAKVIVEEFDAILKSEDPVDPTDAQQKHDAFFNLQVSNATISRKRIGYKSKPYQYIDVTKLVI